jgi:hypothetical protein
MFARRFFAARHFAPRYFPSGSDTAPEVVLSEDQYWSDVIGFRMIGG